MSTVPFNQTWLKITNIEFNIRKIRLFKQALTQRYKSKVHAKYKIANDTNKHCVINYCTPLKKNKINKYFVENHDAIYSMHISKIR